MDMVDEGYLGRMHVRMGAYSRFMASSNYEAKEPVTAVKSGGGMSALFKDKDWNQADLKKYRNVFEQGGLVTEAIRIIPLYIFMNDYRLEGDKKFKDRIKLVQETLDKTKFGTWGPEGVTEALVCGSGFQEIVPTKGDFPIGAIYTRDASKFRIESTDTGIITGYTYFKDGFDKKGVSLKPEQVLHIKLFTSGGKLYGDSIVKSAFDDIMRDVITTEGASNAIKRHGTPKYHIKVGSNENRASKAQIDLMNKEFEEINSKNEWTTTHDVQMDMVDNTNLGFNLEAYNRISLQRVITALGVPAEVLGLREGTTDATAVSRINTFYKKIGRLQKAYADIVNDQIINRVLGEGSEGKVKLVFNEIDAANELDKVNWINLLLKADALNPWAVISREQVYKFMGWEIDDYKPDLDEIEVQLPDDEAKPPLPGQPEEEEEGGKA